MKTLEQLRPFIGIQSEHNPTSSNPIISHVTGDSRTVVVGSLFVAISGDSYDGHRFIADAVERGAVAVIGTASVERLASDGIAPPISAPYCQVPDSRSALAWSSAALHDFPSRSMTVIGITGTDGKTSSATLLESILVAASRDESSPAGRVGVITTVGARIGGQEQETGLHVTTPDAPDVQRHLAAMRQAGCDYAIIESTSHGLAQGRVAAVDFDVAAVTNITHEHLDYHGSWAAYAEAKALLFRMLLRSESKLDIPRLAVLNADDVASFDMLNAALAKESEASNRTVPVLSYGLVRDSQLAAGTDVIAEQIAYHPDRTTFDVTWRGAAFSIKTPLIGEFNVHNILCATTIGLELGIPIDSIQRGVASLKGIVGRMERIDRGQPFLALVDFAHSPASLERALKTLRTIAGQDRQIIALFGSAGLRDQEKRALMGAVSGRLADFTVITAEDPRTEDLDAINHAIESGVTTYADVDAYAVVPDRLEAIQYAVNMARPGDIVAAFGKGHERSMCFGDVEFPWSDQDAMSKALDALRNRRG